MTLPVPEPPEVVNEIVLPNATVEELLIVNVLCVALFTVIVCVVVETAL